MSLDHVFLSLLMNVLDFSDTLFSQFTHYLFFLFISEFIIVVTLIYLCLLLMIEISDLACLAWVVKSSLLIFQLLFNLDGLILDGLLHDHVGEDVRCHLLHRAGCCHIFVFSYYLNLKYALIIYFKYSAMVEQATIQST